MNLNNLMKLNKALTKEPSCCKNCMSPSCIDLYLTICPKNFESTLTVETGLSAFNKLIATVLKVKHEKFPLKLYNTETTKTLTQQDFLKNFK